MSPASSMLIARTATAFPPQLHAVHPVPEQLYVAGDYHLLHQAAVSIIGSRKMSGYGAAVLRLLIPPLVRSGLVIVSGLAYGVDGEAHRLALAEHGKCVAVLGSALDNVYPAAHRGLFQKILACGGSAVSEYEPGTRPYPGNFPARNRLVAGLSLATVIIEAGESSGTLSTAQHALEAGREVCVVPADITRPQSAGVHHLLKQGARPVTCAEDIINLYQLPLPLPASVPLRPALTGSLATLYDYISHGVTSTEALLQSTHWSARQLSSALSVLELDGYIVYKERQWLKIS